MGGVIQRRAGEVSLLCPAAVQVDHVVIVGVEVGAGTVGALDVDRLVGGVGDHRVASDDRKRLENGVEQRNVNTRVSILGLDLKGSCVGLAIGKGCGQTLKGGLACVYFMREIMDQRGAQ